MMTKTTIENQNIVNYFRENAKKNLVGFRIVRTFALPFEGETVQSSDNLKGNNCGLEQTVSSSDS